MKKTLMIVAAGLLAITGLKAQNLQEGINHLYADRFKSAIAVFEKLIAANPNNTDAAYWLGQTYLDEDRNELARQLYDKTLASSNNAPLILVGRGHVDLLENKTNEARQKFEAALTATRGKKGDDPVILNAIGRANVDAKLGDLKYAVEKLEAAVQKDPNNPEILLNLGNAYRKAGEGNGGGQAYTSYQKALAANPNFAVAYMRLAKLFEAQKNWELNLENLNKAVSVDPKFSPAYYELFFYNFYRVRLDEAEAFLKKYIDSRAPEVYLEDQYLYAQLCWAHKDWNCAITKAESVVTGDGALTKPKVYKLLADAYAQKGDINNAKKYIDMYFAKEKPEQVIGKDYALQADIYSKVPGQEEQLVGIYLKGAEVDTVIDDRVETLKKGAKFFKDNKMRDKEAVLLTKMLEIKPKPTLNDYFDQTLAYYFSKQYDKSRAVATSMVEKYPTEIYGYDWAFNNARLIDTVKKDSIAVPDAIKLFDFSAKDTSKFKKQYITSASYLAGYYANDANDKAKAIDYLKKWQAVDTANALNIQKNIEILQRPPAGNRTNPRGNSAPKPAGNKPSPVAKPKISATIKK